MSWDATSEDAGDVEPEARPLADAFVDSAMELALNKRNVRSTPQTATARTQPQSNDSPALEPMPPRFGRGSKRLELMSMVSVPVRTLADNY